MATITGNGSSNNLNGTAAADDVYAYGGNDTVRAGDGNDTVFGGNGSDSILGEAGNDSLLGEAGNDRLFGGDGNDSLYGGASNDSLEGGAGDDLLNGGAGTDTLIGGDGLDTADYSDSAAGVTVNLTTGTATGADIGTDTLSQIENINGSDFADSLTGNSGDNVVAAGGGDDTVSTGSGDDVVYGGSGNDVIDAGVNTQPANTALDFNWSLAGPDEANVAGGVTQDTGGIQVGISFTNDGAATEFSIETSTPLYVAPGEPFSNTSSLYLYGSGGNQTSTTTIDFSSVPGSGYADEVENVRFRLEDIDRVNGAWEDRITIRAYDANGNLIPVTLTASGADVVTGNTVVAAEGNNSSSDAQGSVLVTVAGPVARVEIDYDNGFTSGQLVQITDIHFEAVASDNDTVDGGDGNDTITTGIGNDSILGGAGNDSIDAGVGNDTLDGGIGNDTLLGGAGADLLSSGDGNDLLYGGTGDDTINFGAGDDTIYGGDGNDLIDDAAGINLFGLNLVYGGAGNDTIWTGSGTDTVYGGDGNDRVFGEGDDDQLYGDLGLDTLYGGDGNDTLFGGADNDSLFGGAGNDSVSGDDGADTLLGEAGDDQLFGGLGNDSLDGGDGFDNLSGGDGSDSLFGGADNDTLSGGLGADSLSGGTGNDSLSGDSGNDTLEGDDGNDTLLGGIGDDSLFGGTGNDSLDGGDGSDSLFGGAGSDSLFGGAGADFIDGGADQDTIYGGIGDTVTGGGTGTDLDTLDLTAYGKALTNIIFDPVNPENGTVEFLDSNGAIIGTMTFKDIETVIPCFTPGTQLMTPNGLARIEDLVEGDMVLTRDNGLQPIRWVGTRTLTIADLVIHTRFRPVRLPAGCLGANAPNRDMLVSPQHRMLLEGSATEMLFGESEVLVAATHLQGQNGIEQVLTNGVTYIHIMFDQHEIVNADGCWTESFQPGAATLGGMPTAQRDELLHLFPEIAEDPRSYASARPTLKGHEARVLLNA